MEFFTYASGFLMRHKIFAVVIGVLFVLVLFEAYVRFFSIQQTTIIKMTETGFVPAQVRISQGTAITFVNEDTEPHWPASNMHPVHTFYPGSDIRKCSTPEEIYIFDACKPILPGDSYTFVFRESGGWGFHDHMYSTFFGGVDVLPVEHYKKSPAPPSIVMWRIFDKIFNFTFQAPVRGLDLFRSGFGTTTLGLYSANDLKSTKNYENESALALAADDLEIRRMITQLGVKRVIEKMTIESQNFSRSCHPEAHYVGRAVYDLFGLKGLIQCSESCVFGCYHGVTEMVFNDSGASALGEAEALCSTLDTGYERHQCFHGLGHGLFTFANADLLGAIDGCKRLDGSAAQEACYGGAFMENGSAALGRSTGNEGHLSEWLVWGDSHFPCNQFNDDTVVQEWCYAFQGSWIFVNFGHDFDAAVDECQNAPEGMVSACISSIARNFAGHSQYNPFRIEQFCTSIPQDQYEACIIGATKMKLDRVGPTIENDLHTFCENLTAPSAQALCYTEVTRSIPYFFSDYASQANLCRNMPTPYSNQCLDYIEE